MIVYKHIRLDTNQTFYVGIGKDNKRAYNKRGRSLRWKDIGLKINYEVQILKSNLTLEDAVELEKILIQYYGRIDIGTGILVNMTDGGDGDFNRSKETMDKINKWKQNMSSETKDKMSKSKLNHKINLGKNHTQETKLKIGLALRYKVIDTLNNKIYNSVQEVADLVGISRINMVKKLNGLNQNNTTFKYLHEVNI